MKRIAIFHNYMDNIGGAEMVTLQLAQKLNVPIFTTNIDKKKIKKMGYKDVTIHSIGKVPINAPFKHQLALWKFHTININKTQKQRNLPPFDHFIISGDWAVSAARKNKPCTWYAHSPPRELFDLKKSIMSRLNPIKAGLFFIWSSANSVLFKHYVKKIPQILCNSKNTQTRITKYLNRKSIIIYPPVDTHKFKPAKKTSGPKFWLAVNRLFWHKNIEVQLDAFRKMPDKRLIIIGSYEQSTHFKDYAEHIKSICPPNVTIKSWVSDTDKIKLYQQCEGLICTAKDEDFGLTPLEAMACGKPVIANKEGGFTETILHKKTGILIEHIDSTKIVSAINSIQNMHISRKDCQEQAKKFDTAEFIKKIKEAITN